VPAAIITPQWKRKNSSLRAARATVFGGNRGKVFPRYLAPIIANAWGAMKKCSLRFSHEIAPSVMKKNLKPGPGANNRSALSARETKGQWIEEFS